MHPLPDPSPSMNRKRRQPSSTSAGTRADAGATAQPGAPQPVAEPGPDPRQPPPSEPPPESAAPASRQVLPLALPLLFVVALAAFGLMPSALENPGLQWSFFGAAGVLLLWNVLLFSSAWRRRRPLGIHLVVRRPH